MRRVVSAKADKLLIDAANAAGDVTVGNRMTEKVTAIMDNAARYRHFLEILAELRQEKIHSTINITAT